MLTKSNVLFFDRQTDSLWSQLYAVAVTLDGTTKIYPFSELRKAGARVRDKVGGKEITIEFDRKQKTASARGTDGEPVGTFFAYFTQLKAFYPDAEIFKAK